MDLDQSCQQKRGTTLVAKESATRGEFWLLSRGIDEWAISDVDPRVWTATNYWRGENGGSPESGTHITQGRRNAELRGVEGEETSETWKEIGLERGYLGMTGKYRRRQWISPDDIYEALMWISRKGKSLKTEIRFIWDDNKIAKEGNANAYSKTRCDS